MPRPCAGYLLHEPRVSVLPLGWAGLEFAAAAGGPHPSRHQPSSAFALSLCAAMTQMVWGAWEMFRAAASARPPGETGRSGSPQTMQTPSGLSSGQGCFPEAVGLLLPLVLELGGHLSPRPHPLCYLG